MLKGISDRIKYWSNVTVKSYRKNLNRSLFKDEIYEHIIKEFPTLSFSNFKYLHTLENKKQEETYLTIHYNPGEIVQFDWGYMTMNLNDSNKRIYFAVFYFPYSHYHICAVTDKEASVNFHHVFQYFLSQVKNIPEKLVIDNMKIANKLSIKLSPKTNNENKLTRFFQELSDYYKFKVCFCAVNCPNQKGHVETGVKVVKNIIKNSGISEFKSLEHIKDIIDEQLNINNNKMHSIKNNTRSELFKEEKSLMNPLPSKNFTFFHYTERIVASKKLFITLNTCKYLVPEGQQGEKLIIRYNNYHVYILSNFGEILAKYNYSHKKKTLHHRVWYIPNRIKIKHRGFENSSEYLTMPKWLKNIYFYVYNSNPIEFSNMLEIAKNKQKYFLKKALKRNNVSIFELTKQQLEKEINR